MSRWAAKVSAKNRAISSLNKINEYLAALSKGTGEPLDKIEVELLNLKAVETPPQIEPGIAALKTRLPAYLRKRTRSTIKKVEDLIQAYRDWEIK